MKVSNYFKTPLEIDGEMIVFLIKRMSLEEYSEFATRGEASAVPTQYRFIARDNSAEEQARDDDGNYKIALEDLAIRKRRELDPETKKKYLEAVEFDELESRRFLIYMFESFVKVGPGYITEELETGEVEEITEGLDVLRIFGARNDVLQAIFEAVRLENTLTAVQKKAWKSVSGSSRSSTELGPARPGRKRARTAKNVKTSASAKPGDVRRRARRRPASGQSGPTARSSSNIVRSSS